MLGMSEYQLELMFEYIDLKATEVRDGQWDDTSSRMAEIRKILLDEARNNEDRLDKIGKSLESMRNSNTPTWGP
jgi:hypothetical protein